MQKIIQEQEESCQLDPLSMIADITSASIWGYFEYRTSGLHAITYALPDINIIIKNVYKCYYKQKLHNIDVIFYIMRGITVANDNGKLLDDTVNIIKNIPLIKNLNYFDIIGKIYKIFTPSIYTIIFATGISFIDMISKDILYCTKYYESFDIIVNYSLKQGQKDINKFLLKKFSFSKAYTEGFSLFIIQYTSSCIQKQITLNNNTLIDIFYKESQILPSVILAISAKNYINDYNYNNNNNNLISDVFFQKFHIKTSDLSWIEKSLLEPFFTSIISKIISKEEFNEIYNNIFLKFINDIYIDTPSTISEPISTKVIDPYISNTQSVNNNNIGYNCMISDEICCTGYELFYLHDEIIKIPI